MIVPCERYKISGYCTDLESWYLIALLDDPITLLKILDTWVYDTARRYLHMALQGIIGTRFLHLT